MDVNKTDPILEENLLSDIDLEIDSVIKEEIKKATFKTKSVKLDMSEIKWDEYKTMNKNYGYHDEIITHKHTEQINGLWQTIKSLEKQIEVLSTIAKDQNKLIKKLEEQIGSQQADNIIEINDRLDDIESRLNLIDE
jgi:chaperonin cofactor prefoldin